MTILLLYFSWKDSFFGSIKLPIDFLNQEENIPLPETRQLISPNEIMVNFGSDTHTVIARENYSYWDDFALTVNGFISAEKLQVNEITKSQFEEAMNFRSICVKFDYDLPLKETLSQLKLPSFDANISVDMFTWIAYSNAIEDSIMIYDGKNQKYYRLISDFDLSPLRDMIGKIENNAYDPYFPMRTFLGIDNPTLMPISVKTEMEEISFSKELNYFETDKIINFAQTFFGEGFDFVRTITESSGTTIFMYGYGQKILIISKDGTIEYKEELEDSDYNTLNYFDSFNSAVSFIGAHGSWESLNGTKLVPFLKDVETITLDGKAGYRFTFGMMIHNRPLYLNGRKELLSVDLIGNRVVNYKRQMLDISKNTLDSMAAANWKQTIDPINILTDYHMEIKTVLNAAGIIVPGTKETELFENTSILIDEIKMGYVKIDEKDGMQTGKIYPAWIFRIGDISIYFDIFTGKQLGNPESEIGGS
jgi:hypothetical protein